MSLIIDTDVPVQVTSKWCPCPKVSWFWIIFCCCMVIVIGCAVVMITKTEDNFPDYAVCEFRIIEGKCQYNTDRECTQFDRGIRMNVVENIWTVYSLYDDWVTQNQSVETFTIRVIGTTTLCQVHAILVYNEWCPKVPGACDVVYTNVLYKAIVF